jgi:hypothetical protein
MPRRRRRARLFRHPARRLRSENRSRAGLTRFSAARPSICARGTTQANRHCSRRTSTRWTNSRLRPRPTRPRRAFPQFPQQPHQTQPRVRRSRARTHRIAQGAD